MLDVSTNYPELTDSFLQYLCRPEWKLTEENHFLPLTFQTALQFNTMKIKKEEICSSLRDGENLKFIAVEIFAPLSLHRERNKT